MRKDNCFVKILLTRMIVLSFNVKEKKKCVIVEMNSIVYPQQRNERNLSIETDQCKGVS